MAELKLAIRWEVILHGYVRKDVASVIAIKADAVEVNDG